MYLFIKLIKTTHLNSVLDITQKGNNSEFKRIQI